MVIYNGSISVVKYFRDNILDGTVVFTLLFEEWAVRGLHWSSCIMSSFLFQIHLLKLSAHRAYFIWWVFFLFRCFTKTMSIKRIWRPEQRPWKISGKLFISRCAAPLHLEKEALPGPGPGPSGPSKRTVLDDDSSSDDDIARTVPYRTPAFTQAIVQSPRIFVSYQWFMNWNLQ